MARPREHDKRVTINVRMPPELHARLRAAADDREVGVNLLAVHALEHYLEQLRPVDEVLVTRD